MCSIQKAFNVEKKTHPLSPGQELRAGFKMNEKREILFRQRFIELNCRGIEMTAKRDWGMAALYFGDLADMMRVMDDLENGKIEAAVVIYKNCDTACRDKFPDFVPELAGYTLRHPNPEETLEGTKD